MDAPPEHESVRTFARVAARFKELGLNVPVVFEMEESAGFALLSDLGSLTYLQALDGGDPDTLYGDALDALYRLQAGSVSRLDELEPYDAGRLQQEMELFRQWFVPHRTSHRLSAADHRIIDGTFRALVDSALEQPRAWVHRDYHSRNLMVTQRNNPGILDFQDAVAGPVTYDLVSLLRDCYVRWPARRTRQWLDEYFRRIRSRIPPSDRGPEQFTRWFDWMGVQRHVKVLGIFTRLYHRDGKANYLGDLPLVYEYVREVCGRYPELRPFGTLLESMEVSWTP